MQTAIVDSFGQSKKLQPSFFKYNQLGFLH